jgi:hypothetical protein
MRDVKRLTGRVLLALAMILTPAFALAQEEKEAPPEKKEAPKTLEELDKDVRSSFEAAYKDINALREEVDRLRKELEDLKKQKTAVRQSDKPRIPAATGSIRMVNTYVQSVTVVVNGTKYVLAPGESRILRDQTPGGFTYEIPGVQKPVDRTLDANETFTIRIHSR